jgi:hypothetical protein
LLFSATSLPALTIVPIWDATITNDPNAAVIESTITSAIQFYQARFGDPMTISIYFEELGGGLGQSAWGYWTFPYSQYYYWLQQDAKTTNDSYALAYLPNQSVNPVNFDGNINILTANLKALGQFFYGPGYPNGIEGYVGLNTSVMNLSRTNVNPSKYDLLRVAEHEIDEVLGLDSDVDGMASSGDPFPEDLFRYDSFGNRSYTTAGDDAWFSLDGINRLVQFNQSSSGDYGDWWSTSQPAISRVQDASMFNSDMPNPTVELIALDVIGYDLLPPPRPSITRISVSGTNLTVTGTNGLSTGTYYLLACTNLGPPLSQWARVATNTLWANGNFSFVASNAVSPSMPRRFYALQLQQ